MGFDLSVCIGGGGIFICACHIRDYVAITVSVPNNHDPHVLVRCTQTAFS